MKSAFHQPSWAPETLDRDSVTQIYFKPEPQPVVSPVQYAAYLPPTQPVERPSQPGDRRRISPTMLGLGFATACVLIGITIGSMIGFSGHAAAVAAPSVRTAPHVTAAPAPAASATIITNQPARVTVRIESQPTGASAMIVDNGKTSPVGKTPIEVQLDGSRAYELIVTLDNHETQVVHLDPATTQHLAVELPAVVAEPAPALVPAPLATHHRHVDRPTAATEHKPAAELKPASKPPTGELKVPSKPTGELKVSAKPPCSIMIDGEPTGLMTPRTIPLSAGSHQVELINAAEGIHLTTEVEVHANRPTLLIQDFTN